MGDVYYHVESDNVWGHIESIIVEYTALCRLSNSYSVYFVSMISIFLCNIHILSMSADYFKEFSLSVTTYDRDEMIGA